MNIKSIFFGVALLVLAGCSSTGPGTAVNLSGLVVQSGDALAANGRVLNLQDASLTEDGETANLAVAAGMEIAGEGSDDNGGLRMRRVDVRWRARGTVDAVDVTNSTLDVVGLRGKVGPGSILVQVNPDGSRSPLTLSQIEPGDYVKMAGVPQADDSVLVTRLERKTEDNPGRVELRLKLRNLDTTAKTFTYGLRTYTVKYSGAQVEGTLSEGVWVRVRATKSGNILSASRVRTARAEDGNKPNGQEVELKGLVEDLDTISKTFSLGGFSINYSRAEVKGALANGVLVEVEGSVSGSGQIEARKVEVEDENKIGQGEVEGTVSDFNATAQTLRIAGVPISTKPTTKYEINSNEVSSSVFWASDRNGSRAKAKGQTQAGTLVADKLEIK
ncbi:MAG: hypothetical protein KatS3mg074_404 [Meiothermus sp.]|nr:MAG: hypothetical protein KatS3mg074_404 [Meiothermus sp.]